MKIAIVCNRRGAGNVVATFGRQTREFYGLKAVAAVLDALSAAGHTARVVEGDTTMVDELRAFMPPDAHGMPTGLVFNMAYGIQGDCRYTHVPAVLEMAGIPYTGSGPLGHTLALDKVVTKHLLVAAGVPTPAFATMAGPGPLPDHLRYPVVVKPRHESTSFGLALVDNDDALAHAVRTVVAAHEQDALIEQYIEGREVAVSLLGNEPPEALPITELDFGSRSSRLFLNEDKRHRSDDEPSRICPAPLDPPARDELVRISQRTFAAVHCRDYARVDIRIDEMGAPWVLEINSMASLGLNTSFVHAARVAGLDFGGAVLAIVAATVARYGDRLPAAMGVAPEVSGRSAAMNVVVA